MTISLLLAGEVLILCAVESWSINTVVVQLVEQNCDVLYCMVLYSQSSQGLSLERYLYVVRYYWLSDVLHTLWTGMFCYCQTLCCQLYADTDHMLCLVMSMCVTVPCSKFYLQAGAGHPCARLSLSVQVFRRRVDVMIVHICNDHKSVISGRASPAKR